MHFVKNTEPIKMGVAFGVLEPGAWVMQDQNAFECAMLAKRGSVRLESFATNGDAAHPTLIMRSGAIGDLLLTMPALRAWRAANPGWPVHLSCLPKHAALFEGINLVDQFLPYPLPDRLLMDYARVISLENVIENESEQHATDAFAQKLDHVKVTDYRPDLRVTTVERETAAHLYKRKRPLLGMQLRATVRNRDYPMHLWAQVFIELENRGWEILLLGRNGEIPGMPPNLRRAFIRDLSTDQLTIRQTAAVISVCDAFLGPDSGLIQIARALDIPAVGLYGPIRWQTRVGKDDRVTALTGVGACAGCGWNIHGGHHFPPDQPCRERKLCHVLASIEPARVVAKVDELRPK